MNEANRDPAKIDSRCFGYALRAIKLDRFIQTGKDGVAWIIGKQYLRSATSIGANVEEAQSAESRADFIHKYGIAQKETRESLYWLRLLAESSLIANKRLAPLIKETEELYAIITAILIKSKRNL